MAGCASDCLGCYMADISCCPDWESLSGYVKCRSLTMAWDTLKLLTGGRIVNCPVEMRPCLQPPCDVCHGYWEPTWMDGPWGGSGPMQGIFPRIVNGCWVNSVCGQGGCSCPPLCEILFPGEVAKVCRVTIDGVDLQVDQWRVDDNHRLVRTDGECWPSCQDMSLPPDHPNTMMITYMPGILPNTAGLYAAGTLACEYAKLCSGGKCRLPSGVTNLVRQGVSMQMNEAQFPGGLTGIPEVDSFVMSVNPYHRFFPPKVWSPDMQSQKHRFVTQEAYVPLP